MSKPHHDIIEQAIRRLSDGGVVAIPTETVYGLAADAFNANAVYRVFELKGRPAVNPVIVHASSARMARGVTAGWDRAGEQLAEAFWPGPLTLIYHKAMDVPDVVTAGGPTVGVRVPKHRLALDLIELYGGPLIAPSANPSGYVSPTTAGHVRDHFAESDVLVIDGGPCETGIESTVIDMTAETPTILRPGAIGPDAIANVLRREVRSGTEDGGRDAIRSPGVIGPHYQPASRLIVVSSIEDLDAALARSQGPAVVLNAPGAPVTVDPPHMLLPMPHNAHDYARELYAALREADHLSPSVIIVAMPETRRHAGPEAAIWAAVHERLQRASADGLP